MNIYVGTDDTAYNNGPTDAIVLSRITNPDVMTSFIQILAQESLANPTAIRTITDNFPSDGSLITTAMVIDYINQYKNGTLPSQLITTQPETLSSTSSDASPTTTTTTSSTNTTITSPVSIDLVPFRPLYGNVDILVTFPTNF